MSSADAETLIGVSQFSVQGGAASAAAPAEARSSQQNSTAIESTLYPARQDVAPEKVDFGPRYRVEKLLGQGGMGAVYKAWDNMLERTVALKLIRPGMAADANVEQRFKQELLLASKISHRNILRIHDLGEAAGMKFISMAYVEGQDLQQLLSSEGRLPLERVVSISKQLCAALDAAHHEGVVHRDLKPQNILLDKQENVFVSDFGLAKSLETDASMTRSGEFLGTPRYMAPEQVIGGKVDHRADIYAFGLIFYEMVTGDIPFHADSTMQLLFKRVHELPEAPKTVNPDLPEWISGVIMRCIERNPDDRYQSAREVLKDIEAGTAPPTLKKMPEARKFSFALPQMTRIRWMAAGTGIVVLAMTGTWFVVRHRLSSPVGGKPISVLVGDFTNNTGDPVFDGTLEPMMNVALEGASFINAFNRGRARSLAEHLPTPADKLDEQHARLVAVSQGVSTITTGAVSRRGANYTVEAVALDAMTGNVIARSEVSAASKEDLLKTMPKLAAPIRTALGDSTPEAVQIERAGGAFTAANLEVVHQYGIGMEQQFAGKVQDALQSFGKAAELDPTFARAYSGMTSAALKLDQQQDAEKYIKLAMQHVDRMTDRERYRIRGFYYMTSGDWQKCSEEYSDLAKHYPGDNIAHNNLAVCLGQLREFSKAIDETKLDLRANPNASAAANLSFLLSYSGDFEGGERESRRVQQDYPTFEYGYLAQSFAQLGSGRLKQAAETYLKLKAVSSLGASMAAAGLGDLAIYDGRFSDAAEILEQGIATDLAAKRPDAAADKLISLAYAQLSSGRNRPAVVTAEKALSNSNSTKTQLMAALVFIDAGETARAEKIASTLAQKVEAEPQAYSKIIQGRLAIKRKDTGQAIKNLNDAQGFLNTWIGRMELGRAYLESEAFTQADSEFDDCVRHRGEALSLFLDQTPTFGYFPSAYFYQGKAREGLKSPGAKDSYSAYLEIRGEAAEDPLLPQIQRQVGK